MLIALMGLGFAAAAGLNAFLPLAILATLSRFTGLVELSSGFSWLASWPAIIVILCLLTIELILDKIPGVDTVNDVFQTPLRPAVGALVFMASVTAEITGTDQAWMCPGWVAWTLGALIGLTVHLCKAASRTAIGAATGGSGTALASFAEDGLALSLCLFALVMPLLVLPILVGMGFAVYRIVTIGRRRRQRIAERQRRWREEREAAEIAAGLRGWLARPTRRLLARAGLNGNGKDPDAPKVRRYRRTFE
jgi:uncharacterized membrane protein